MTDFETPVIELKQISFDPDRMVYSYQVINQSGEVVGFSQLRLKGSKGEDMPDNFESNIYYETFEPFRKHGYGSASLRELIKKAASFNLSKVVATVNADNIYSISIIEKCGGKQIDKALTTHHQEVIKYELPTDLN